MSTYGTNINYHLLDNSPSGRVRCKIASWIGEIYKIPRTEIEKSKVSLKEIESSVYFLFGESNKTGKKPVYVGQSGFRKNKNGILSRLREHDRNPNKNYWTEVVVVTASGGFLAATETNWLENYFCTLARDTGRYDVKNGNEPSPGMPKEEIMGDLEKFAEYTKTIIRVLGYRVFEQNNYIETNVSNGPLFYCRRKNVEATGKRTSGGFVVYAGSQLALSVANYAQGCKISREKNAKSIDKNGILLENVVFTSSSSASTFVVGKNSNGRVDWKTSDGKTLKEIEASE